MIITLSKLERELELFGLNIHAEKGLGVIITELVKTYMLNSDGYGQGQADNEALGLFVRFVQTGLLSPLTGENDEWDEVGHQNKRDSDVFKDVHGEAYWTKGKIFRKYGGSKFLNRDSWVYIDFPWSKPGSTIVDVDDDENVL